MYKMKTSNKLLIAGYGLILLALLSLLIFVKTSVKTGKYESSNSSKGNGEIINEILLDNYTSTNLKLDGPFSYALDDSRSDISVVGDENIIKSIKVNDDNQLSFYIEDDQDYQSTNGITIYIGTAEKQGYNLTAGGRASIDTEGWISAETIDVSSRAVLNVSVNNPRLKVTLDHRAMVDLDFKGDDLFVKAGERAMLDLRGDVQTCNMNLSNRVIVNGDAFTTSELESVQTDRSQFEIGKVDVLSAAVHGRSILNLSKPYNTKKQIVVTDRGIINNANESITSKK